MQEGRKLFLSPTLPFGEFIPSHVHACIHPSTLCPCPSSPVVQSLERTVWKVLGSIYKQVMAACLKRQGVAMANSIDNEEKRKPKT